KIEDVVQIYTVQQQRSWTTLDISRKLFEQFLELWHVFPEIWNCVSTFGMKHSELQCSFPTLSIRRSPSKSMEQLLIESTCVLRRVELNNRVPKQGQSPWSIRQMGVYHQHLAPLEFHAPSPETDSRVNKKSTFLLLCPSERVTRKIDHLVRLAKDDQDVVSPYVIFGVLIHDSTKGWEKYVAWLEQDLSHRSDSITFAELGSERGKDLDFSVEDRQELKVFEDSVIDAQTILSTMLETTTRIQDYCGSYFNAAESTDHSRWMFQEANHEMRLSIDKIRASQQRLSLLKDKVVSCSQLDKSMRDAESMKVLTVIGLVYLPTTIVANFFSTEFVQTDNGGHLKLATNSWLLAAIALPLTLFTVVLWWICVRYRSSALPPSIIVHRCPRRDSSLLSLLGLTKRHQERDIESFGASSTFSSSKTPVGTWSTVGDASKSLTNADPVAKNM
ncbi:hypothetical protein K490DRAFT_49258, partial [Saccharata proteae CBS 121410]